MYVIQFFDLYHNIISKFLLFLEQIHVKNFLLIKIMFIFPNSEPYNNFLKMNRLSYLINKHSNYFRLVIIFLIQFMLKMMLFYNNFLLNQMNDFKVLIP